MFYVKKGRKKYCLTSENIYTCCPECGAEFQVKDILDYQPGDIDLDSTQLLCPACSDKWQAEHGLSTVSANG